MSFKQNKPGTAPDFLLSRPDRSLRTQGAKSSFTDPFEAATALRDRDVDLVVGAVPFNTSERSALVEPERVIRAEGPLEPPAFFRGKEAAESLTVTSVEAATSPDEHRATVAAAVATIAQTRLEKVVLARAVDVTYEHAPDPLLIAARFLDLSANRDGFAVDLSSTGRDEHVNAMFVGSSPEVLIRRSGRNISAFPLAGSAPRTGTLSVDEATARNLMHSSKDFDEHRYVVDHYRKVLESVCESLTIPATPSIHETSEMIHLGTPISGRLKDDDYSALDLALMLHPTPAIGGTPTDDALGIITEVEEPREFYAGFVGWCDSTGDGEYMVSIRCAMVEDNNARAWAGGGIVVDSSPNAETDETSAKLQTALRALNVPAALRIV
ncbi:isochorismate synthase [Corynebacterium sp. zg254]|uniref:isochorismate synthase n=1 Tax=Corynebacterium zhongnanshanii TaxID=2768834 RepID=A0ABQ6VG29_9CORY|nr:MULTISPECIES: isochorismate synthase [Corynebacterium]KAB3523268.1 isochorismate synthase [Corynebacterium zhongnanshanii]MCR5913614.1 isochorismate synthase [Corynebacterium sp. zg254]